MKNDAHGVTMIRAQTAHPVPQIEPVHLAPPELGKFAGPEDDLPDFFGYGIESDILRPRQANCAQIARYYYEI